ncbi:helix-turn-helix domain-containing protein [Brevibacillus ruminantium]|uniref:Helix-turn-helix domain-containing protein n=1 Tax=Brevibacillus ruminantium TaxID=2950604 RepID=A0ABY4WAK4_9BACL|nr:Ada metal-binding domain-containing protein [Brevibacillus ruminantium]USG64197.1 helix-turn-helix domain-containing protein [Brevibacillus ruminantium]
MNEEIWRAVVECDPAYDGKFYYGVLTTGIFCKPSCKSRTPKREHVRIFATLDEAQRTGLRPCKRCQPHKTGWQSADEELTQRAEQLISECYTEPLTLREMAARLFISPYYLLRCFRRLRDCSPGQYLIRKRLEAARELLRGTSLSVAQVAHQVGFRNSAHFSHVFHQEMKQTPTEFRRSTKEE